MRRVEHALEHRQRIGEAPVDGNAGTRVSRRSERCCPRPGRRRPPRRRCRPAAERQSTAVEALRRARKPARDTKNSSAPRKISPGSSAGRSGSLPMNRKRCSGIVAERDQGLLDITVQDDSRSFRQVVEQRGHLDRRRAAGSTRCRCWRCRCRCRDRSVARRWIAFEALAPAAAESGARRPHPAETPGQAAAVPSRPDRGFAAYPDRRCAASRSASPNRSMR